MDKEKYFTIGEICELTKVPCSALRYYDRAGVLKPAYIDNTNGYRYYDSEALQSVLVLRYYQILGFKLKEIPELLERENLFELREFFEKKIAEETNEIALLTMSRDSLQTWVDLIDEAKMVLSDENRPISLREFPKQKMIYVKPKKIPKMEFRNLLINHEICTSLYPINTTILGALYIEYPNEDVRFGQDYTGVSLFIKNHDAEDNLPNIKEVGGFSAVVCYHKGSYSTIHNTYEKMKRWASDHNFILKGNSIERYVIDYWSTINEDWIVTEIFLPLENNP